LREGRKSAFRLHTSFLPCAVNALHKLPERTLWYLFVKKLLTGQTWYIYIVGYIAWEDEMGDSKIDHTYGLLIARLAHIHRIRLEEYLSKQHLHVGQEMLLKYLWNQDGRSQKEIGELMEIQSATVTRMVIRMERAGFVERRTDPDDQRVSRVYLTERGRSLQPVVEQGWMAIEQQILADFSLEERLLLRRFLEQIYRNLS
jgi:DNA-binding MarR family transcriptional regulator